MVKASVCTIYSTFRLVVPVNVQHVVIKHMRIWIRKQDARFGDVSLYFTLVRVPSEPALELKS